MTQQHLEILSEIAECSPTKPSARRWPPIPIRVRCTAHHQLATEPASPGLNFRCRQLLILRRPMLQTPLTIQRLYDDNRESLQLGWFAGFPGGERLISGDAVSAADQVGHLNLIHPGRIQVFGHQELNYYQRLKSDSRSHVIGELIAGGPPALIIAQGLDTPPDILAICDEQNIPLFSTPAAGRPGDRLPARLPVEEAGAAHHHARRVHGRAGRGRADHRRLRPRQERAGPGTDLAHRTAWWPTTPSNSRASPRT